MSLDATPTVFSSVLAAFDARTDALTPDDVNAALGAAAQAVTMPSDAERAAGAAELIAFGVRPSLNGSPWGPISGRP